MLVTHPSESSLRVASYNIRKCIGLDRKRDPGRTLDVISALESDIIALQEADRRLAPRPAAIPRELVERASDFIPVSFDGNGPSLGVHGNAILLRRGIHVENTRKIDLPGMEPRGAAVAEVTLTKGRLRIVATHLGLMRRHRQQQLDYLRNVLGKLDDMPTLIMGDFNEWSQTKGLEALSDFEIHSPGRSFHAARPIAGLDKIATDAAFSLDDAGVYEKNLALRASDHLPVWADLKLADAAAG